MLRFLGFSGFGFFALVLVVSASAQTPEGGDKPQGPESFYGKWTVAKCEYQGTVLMTATKIAEMKLDRDGIVMSDSARNEREVRFELFEGETGWAIDLYSQYGALKGKLTPSRIAIDEGRLVLMFPANEEARDERPDSFVSAEQPDWYVLWFERK